MGNYMGKAMEDNFRKNQEFMKEMQAVTLQRQIQMQNQMRERMAAAQVAREIDRKSTWTSSNLPCRQMNQLNINICELQ